MSTELRMLAWAALLGLVQAVATGPATVAQHGQSYGMSARDNEKPLTGVPGRIQRALRNLLETFGFFAVAVLVVQLAGRNGRLSAVGAELYFWCRLVYFPLYVAAVPVLRTVVWVGSIVGIVLVLVRLA